MKTFRVALVGAGTIAKDHYLPQIKAMENAELVAVMDSYEEAAKFAADKFDIPRWFTNLDDLLDKVDCDIVVDTAAIQAHYEINLKALQAGKHLYSQKPLALTVEETTALIETARAKGLKISASPIHMLRPTVQAIKKMVGDGVVGKVQWARVRSSHGGPEYYQRSRLSDPSWFYQPGAGPIFDLGVHGLHTITGILGPAKAVTSMSGITVPTRAAVGCGGDYEGVPFQVNIDDCSLTLLDFGNNSYAFLDMTYCVKDYEGPNLEIFGSRGVISQSRKAGGVTRLFKAMPEDGGPGWEEPEMPQELRYQSIGVKDLMDAIVEGRDPVLTPEHARHVIEIMNKCYQAARERRTLDLETTF